MQNFLQDRETVTGDGAKFIGGEPVTPPSSPGSTWAILRREAAAAGPPAESASDGPGAGTESHEPTVKPIVEDGRVTAVVVTCSCGRTIEVGLEF